MLSLDSFERVRKAQAMRWVVQWLGSQVGSPVSYTSVANDVGVSPNTARTYIRLLVDAGVAFQVLPYSQGITRSILKEPKVYFFDEALVVNDPDLLFMNSTATDLRAYAQRKAMSLHYLRTKEKHEVDFALVKDQQVEMMIEAKCSNHSVGKGVTYFSHKYQFPAFQVVKELRQERVVKGVQVVKADKFLKNLDL